ncbi:MAG: hypothetical protein AABY18_06475 [Candidatus Thermoplasmatota archaeon]
MPIAAGSPVPEFRLQAAVSGREVSPAMLKGKRAVLVLHGVKTQEAPKEVGKAVRAKHPGPDVIVANVLNLKTMGGMWKRVAEAQIKSTYERMAGRITEKEPGRDPADLVLILPDWDNAVAPLFGVADSDAEAAVVVIGADGKVKGLASGKDLGEKATALLG